MATADSDILERAERRIGTVLRGKYRLDRVIGVGGMAVVYRATHRNQAEFAVKMLHPEVSLNADIRSRFLREGYAANSLRHPGAVLVVDDDIAEDGAAFLVMELLDGVVSEQYWESRKGRIPPEVASAIIIQLLDVLAAAHAKGVIHRDIKPANLFLLRTGILKVLDFGIARLRDAMGGGIAVTGTAMMLGTPTFMAPEQARGRSQEIDARTDLWAAAATFFALVSGKYVHPGESPHEVLIAAGTQPARKLASVTSNVPPPIAEIIDRALLPAREERFQSAEMMRDALLAAHRACYGSTPLEVVISNAISPNVRAATPGIYPVATLQPTPFPQGFSSVGRATPGPARNESADPAPRFPGAGTTARPSSNTHAPLGGKAGRPAWFLPATGALLVAGAVASLLVYRSLADRGLVAPAAPKSDAPATRPSDRVAQQPQEADLSVVRIAGDEASPPPPVNETSTDAGPSSARDSVKGSAAAEIPPAPGASPVDAGGPQATPRPAIRPSAATKPNCNPPWYTNAAGIRIYRTECISGR